MSQDSSSQAIRSVSVAILSWNGRQHLETCLPAVVDQRVPGTSVEILVLDNGSTDGTADWLRQRHPEVRLIASAVNLGFCGGVNRLVDEASGDAVVLLNNDTRPRPDWLPALVDALASAPADVAAVSGAIVDWAGERLDFARGLMTFDGHAFQRDFGRPLATVEMPAAGSELLFACGGNMIIRRPAFLRAGGFDDDFFAYLEDVDLGWRLWAGGERVLFTPDAVVHHRSMATSELLGNDNRGFLFERNAFLTAYRNYDDELWHRVMPAVWLTLVHRTQTLLVQNNIHGELLTLDPYAGMLANTARPEPRGEAPVPPIAPSPIPTTSLAEKWRGYGARDFLRRGARKAARAVLPNWLFDDATPLTQLTDQRTYAQLRAMTYLLGHLDEAASKRAAIQQRRRRSDHEIFERFPLALVATYPGDQRLFASDAFASWLPDDLPVEKLALDDIMA